MKRKQSLGSQAPAVINSRVSTRADRARSTPTTISTTRTLADVMSDVFAEGEALRLADTQTDIKRSEARLKALRLESQLLRDRDVDQELADLQAQLAEMNLQLAGRKGAAMRSDVAVIPRFVPRDEEPS